jgi:Immunity protein 26
VIATGRNDVGHAVPVRVLPPTNLQQLEPSRKRVRAGDLFVMLPPDDLYLFGRVIATDAEIGPMKRVLLLYVYAHRSEIAAPPPQEKLLPGGLLIRPQLTNRLGWSRGYFATIDRWPVQPEERLAPTPFRDPLTRRCVDEYGHEIPLPDETELVGQYALGSYRAVDDEISRALGIPLAPEMKP